MPFLPLLVSLSTLILFAIITMICTNIPDHAYLPVDHQMKITNMSANKKPVESLQTIVYLTSSIRVDSDEQLDSHEGMGTRAIPAEDPSIEKMIIDRRRERTERSAGFCPKCGKPIQQSDQYCPGCGEKIVK